MEAHKMTNDLTTVTGCLQEAIDRLEDNLYSMGVNATYNPTTGYYALLDEILNIAPSVGGLNLTTSITLTKSPSIVYDGDTVLLTAIVHCDYDDRTSTNADLKGVLQGATVTFKDNDTVLGTSVTDVNGIATYTVSNITGGNHSFKAVFDATGTDYHSANQTITVEAITSPYTKVEYLQSTGSQYINTGYILKANDKVEVTFSSQGRNAYEEIFGARKSNSDYNAYVLFSRFARRNNLTFNRSGNEREGNGIDLNTIYTAYCDGATCTLKQGDTLVQTVTSTGTVNDCINSCGLFTINTDSGTGFTKDTFSNMKIYSFKIINASNEVVMNLVPVVDDGVGYMYDTVSQTLLTNNGTFQYGNVVNQNGGGK